MNECGSEIDKKQARRTRGGPISWQLQHRCFPEVDALELPTELSLIIISYCGSNEKMVARQGVISFEGSTGTLHTLLDDSIYAKWGFAVMNGHFYVTTRAGLHVINPQAGVEIDFWTSNALRSTQGLAANRFTSTLYMSDWNSISQVAVFTHPDPSCPLSSQKTALHKMNLPEPSCIETGSDPACLALSQDTKELYLTDYAHNRILIFSTVNFSLLKIIPSQGGLVDLERPMDLSFWAESQRPTELRNLYKPAGIALGHGLVVTSQQAKVSDRNQFGILAHNCQTGKLVWNQSTHSKVNQALVMGIDQIFLVHEDCLESLELDTGKRIDSVPLTPRPLMQIAQSKEQNYLLAAAGASIYVLGRQKNNEGLWWKEFR